MMKTFSITSQDKSIIYLKSRDEKLAFLIDEIGDIECHIHENGYQFIVEEIVGQMLSNKVANVLCDRLAKLCGDTISTETISKLTVEQMREIGISKAKTEYIQTFTRAIISKELQLEELEFMEDKEVMRKLMEIKGIGAWTSKMYLLFVLQREDVLPYEDVAFLQSYKWLYNARKLDKRAIEKRCKKWKPYTSIAARYMYRALDMGLTKKPINEIMYRKEERN